MVPQTVLAVPEPPNPEIGSWFESAINWIVENLDSVLSAIGDGGTWTYDTLLGFFETPMIAVFGLLFALLATWLAMRPLANHGLKGGRAFTHAWYVRTGALLGVFVATLVVVSLVATLVGVLGVPVPYLWIVGFGALAWMLRGWRFALFAVIAFGLIFAMQRWDETMESLSLVLIGSVVAIVVGIPVGILAARAQAVSHIVRPILDFMQTLPMFVYLIPAVLVFRVGEVPGIVATIIFAMPPAVRMAELGIRQVDAEVVEAGEAFGAPPLKILSRIQVPLAFPTIMAGVNQVIMLALSMVVIAGMAGAGGLGSVIVSALSSLDTGSGFEAGLAVVFLAIYLDRLTASFTDKSAIARAQRAMEER